MNTPLSTLSHKGREYFKLNFLRVLPEPIPNLLCRMTLPANPEINKRLLSLDVFRGLTIALMIIVNSPGNQTPYYYLEHSPWNGCTLADLVFPFFVFIIGISTVFSLVKLQQKLPIEQLLAKILKRSLIIFLLGLFLNAFPYHFDSATIRFFGVLQRIAICYFISSLLFLTTSKETQLIIFISIVMGYWFIMTQLSVDVEHLTAANNLAAYWDRMLFSPAHLYGKTFDPEGLLSTLPAIATALLGNLTGIWLASTASKWHKFQGLCLAGISILLIGGVWGLEFPLNKTLWTSSYVLWTGGIGLLVLALCYWLIEIKDWKWWSKPFEIFGVNAMLAYVLHVLFLKTQAMILITNYGNKPMNLRLFITQYFFDSFLPQVASLLYALTYTSLWLILLTILYRKKMFVKI